MRNAIIIHGSAYKEEYYSGKFPSSSNSHWLPWVQKQLLINNISAQTPEMPNSYKQDWDIWKDLFEKFPVNEDSILVGHSTGGGFLLRWLSQNKNKVSKLLLVAPFLDPTKRENNKFYEFEINDEIQKRVDEIHIFVSKDEHVEGVPESVDIIKNALPKANIHEFKDKGHFTFDDMGTDEFPELLDVILK